MNRILQAVGLGLVVAALVIMSLPTYVSVSSADDGNGFALSYYRWFDPFMLVYFDVLPMITLGCAAMAAIGLVLGLIRHKRVGWVRLPTALAAILLFVVGYDARRAGLVIGAGMWVAPLLAGAALLAGILWWRERRDEKATIKLLTGR